MTKENEALKRENQDLKTQTFSKPDVSTFDPSISVKKTKRHFDFDPLQSLKDYAIFDDMDQSTDSKIS